MFTPYQGISQIPRSERPGKFSPNTNSLILKKKERKEQGLFDLQFSVSTLNAHVCDTQSEKYFNDFPGEVAMKSLYLKRMTELQLANFTTISPFTEVNKKRTNI